MNRSPEGVGGRGGCGTEVRGGDEAGASSEAKGRGPDTTRVKGRSPQSDGGIRCISSKVYKGETQVGSQVGNQVEYQVEIRA